MPRYFTPEHCEKIRASAFGNENACGKRTPETSARFSTLAKQQWEDPEIRARMIAARRGKHYPKLSAAMRGKNNGMYAKHHTSEAIKKMRSTQKQNWKDPEFVIKVFKGLHTYPNKPEQGLKEILQVLAPGEFKYNGDFSLRILLDGLIPDFVNVNGQKKVIDLHGNYWHKDEDTRVRKMRYAKCGYKLLIIWEKELKDVDNKLQNKLIKFFECGDG